MSDLSYSSVTDGIATVTMNRPNKRNALSNDLIESLEQTIETVKHDDSVRVMILAGEGKSFCAGMDLAGVMSDAVRMRRMLHGLSRVARSIRRLPFPTIAKINGAAIGGGCGLMVVTDFAITHPESKVGYPEVRLGLCPAVVAPWLMRKIGPGPARAMLLLGGTISGEEAFSKGLATHLVEQDQLNSATQELAEQLAAAGKLAATTTKTWLNELDGSLTDDIFDRAADLSADVIATDEAQARLKAQMAK